MLEKLEQLLDKAHNVGIKLPYLRDPVSKTPSVSLTLMIISLLLYILTLVNKLAGWFSDVDGSFQLLILTTSLYFGRSFSGKGKGKADVEKQ